MSKTPDAYRKAYDQADRAGKKLILREILEQYDRDFVDFQAGCRAVGADPWDVMDGWWKKWKGGE